MRMVEEAPEWSGSARLDCVTEAMRMKRKLLRAGQPLTRIAKKGEEEAGEGSESWKVGRRKIGGGRNILRRYKG